MNFWTDIAICFSFLQNVQYILPWMISTIHLAPRCFDLLIQKI